MQLEAIKKRIPRRTYLNKEIEKEKMDLINNWVKEINEESGLNIKVIHDKDKFNNSFLAKRFLYKNVNYYFVIKAQKDIPNVIEKAGFYSEKLAILLESIELNSCFVGIGENKNHIYCDAEENIIYLLVFGYSPGLTKKEKLIRKVANFQIKEKTNMLVTANSLDCNIEEGINSAFRIAEEFNSNLYFYIDDEYIGCYVKNKEYFVLGIAKLHFYLVSNRLIPFGNHNKIRY